MNEELKSNIQYNYIGIEPLTVCTNDTELNFIKFRIPKI